MRNPAPTDTVAALMSVERMFKYEGLGNDFIVVERPAAQRDDAADAALEQPDEQQRRGLNELFR